MRPLTFDRLREASTIRCAVAFNPLNEWSPTDWATAMAGECGEACNEIKKLRRLAETPEEAISLSADARDSYRIIVGRVAKELADTVVYIDLLAARLGLDLGHEVAMKFNEVSERVGSSVKLHVEVNGCGSRKCRIARPIFGRGSDEDCNCVGEV